MTNDRDQHDLEQRLFDELETPLDTPDLTRSIMGRLGYMRAAEVAARRARRRRLAGRTLVALSTVMLVVFGFHVHDQSDQARRPVIVDHQNDREQVERIIAPLRNLAPRFAPVRRERTLDPYPLPPSTINEPAFTVI